MAHSPLTRFPSTGVVWKGTFRDNSVAIKTVRVTMETVVADGAASNEIEARTALAKHGGDAALARDWLAQQAKAAGGLAEVAWASDVHLEDYSNMEAGDGVDDDDLGAGPTPPSFEHGCIACNGLTFCFADRGAVC